MGPAIFESSLKLNNMGIEKKAGKKVETKLAPSTYNKFKAKCKKNGTSQAQVLRDLVQGYLK